MNDFRKVVWLLGAAAAVNMICQVFRATIAAHEFFIARNSVVIVTTLLRAGLTVWTLLRGLGLFGVAISYLAADMVALIIFIVLTRIMTPHVKIRPGYFQWRRLGMVLTFGLTTTIIIATNIIRVNLDFAVIAKLISLEAVAVYGIAATLLLYFNRLLHSGLGVTTPRFAGLDGQNDLQNFRKLLVKALWVSSLLSCLVGLMLLILGKQFIALWVGSE